MSRNIQRIVRTVAAACLALALLFTLAWLLPTAGTPSASAQAGDSLFVRKIALRANHVVYSPSTNMLYASVPSAAGAGGNTVTPVEPLNGAVGTPVFVGSEPNRLAISSDGNTLYTVLDGARAIRRLDLQTLTAGQQFWVGKYFSSTPFGANDLAVAPGAPGTVAVARYRAAGLFPPQAGVVVFDNGVQRPQPGPTPEGVDFLAYSDSASTLYGGRASGLRTMTVDSTGIASVTKTTFSVGERVKFAGGLVYSSTGQVINPAGGGTVLGVFSGANTHAFVPDPAAGRAFYLVREGGADALTLKAYDLNTFQLVGSQSIAGVAGDPTELVRWGANGLAFRTSQSELYIIQTSLIPSGAPIPTPTPTPAAPTPTPTPAPALVRQIELTTNHLVYNPSTQTVFASIPSKAGVGGNSVAQINPLTGAVGAPVFVGSEPRRMAFSDDGQTMYVALDGAKAVRRFDVPTQTPGLQFGVVQNNNFNGPNAAEYLAVMPGQPQTVAVSRFNQINFQSDTVVYDDGVQRPQAASINGAVHFGSSPSRLYAGALLIRRLTLSASGLAFDGPGVDSDGGETQFDRTRGLLFSQFGNVIDPEAEVFVGEFSEFGPIAIDPAAGRVYSLRSNGGIDSGVWDIIAYDMNTFLRVGHATISGIPTASTRPPTDLVRWGANGLAFRVPAPEGGRGDIVFVQTELIDPSSSLPTPTPTPPTPTPTPTPHAATFVRKVSVPANDMVYNEATHSLYASVPSAAGAGGNSVTPIDPLNGALGSPLSVGSEPNRLALADDGRTLYVYLDGANAVRRLDLQTLTAGLQFAAGTQPPPDMEVMPGQPQTLAVSFGGNSNGPTSGGVGIYDDGVQRPRTGSQAGTLPALLPIEFASPSVLYGYYSRSSPFSLTRFDVVADGVTATGVAVPAAGFFSDIKYAGGRVYFSHGQVVDPETQKLVGTFEGAGSIFSGNASVVAVDTALGRAFFITGNRAADTKVLRVYDLNTFVPLGSVTIPMRGTPTRLVRWGANGLAVRTGKRSESDPDDRAVYIIQSTLVSSSVPLPVGVKFDEVERTVSESANEIEVFVLRTGELSQTTEVGYATADGTATAGSDYTAATGTLTFAPGESVKSVKIQIKQDNIFEGHETFTLTLSAPTGGGAVLVGPASAQVTITDDELPPTLGIGDVRVAEGHSGTTDAEFNITLSHPTLDTVTVNYTTGDGTATSPGDYETTSGTVTLPPGATSAVVKVKVVGDTQVEPDETFVVTLSSPSNATFNRSAATGTIVNDEGTTRFQFSQDIYAVGESAGQVVLRVTRSGDLSSPASVNYATSDETAAEVSDYNLTLGTLLFAAGEVEKSFPVLITDDTFAEQQESFVVTLSAPSVGTVEAPSTATVAIVEDDLTPRPNPVVPPGFDPDFFVRQHYHDFLNREADALGLAFWTNEFTKCGADAGCLEVKRVNVSAAFFLSIEFQETGYFIYRIHQAAHDTRETLRWRTFLADTQEIGRGVQVGVGDWRAQIEANKRAFLERFTARQPFTAKFAGMTNAQYVDALAANTYDPRAPSSGGALSPSERDRLISDLNESKKTRAEALRAVTENAEFSRRQFNRAFVLMEYFGYLRRNPDDAPDANFDGYNFWLSKLDEFHGDYIQAEMVKAFINSDEYRRRFGP